MRILNRIIFALIAAIGLYLVIDLSNEHVVKAYINSAGLEAIENDNYDFFVSARYYHNTPLYDDTLTVSDQYEFIIKIYNVANIIEVEDRFEIVEGFQIILHQTDGSTFEMPFAGNIVTATNDDVIQYIGIQISDLPIYTFVTGVPRATFFNKTLFIDDDVYDIPNMFEIVKNEIVVGNFPLQIEETDYQLSAALQTYLDTHNTAPTEAFDDIGYAPFIRIDSSALVVRNSVIYVSIVAIATVLLFVVQRKRMGRKQATEGLKSDVEKLYHKDEERR